MSNEWDEYAAEWDSNPEVKAYAQQAYLQLINFCDIQEKTILDFGCGTGSLTELLASKAQSIVSLDNSTKMVACLHNKALSNVETISDELNQGLLNKRTDLTNKFDIIVASSVCSFLPNYHETLLLLHSLLKEGGQFVQWDWLKEDTINDPSTSGFTKDEVNHALEQSKFTDIVLSTPFQMNSSTGLTDVLMASAKKT